MMEFFLLSMLILCCLVAVVGLSCVICGIGFCRNWSRRLMLLTGTLLLLGSIAGVIVVKVFEKGMTQYRQIKTSVNKSYHQLINTGKNSRNTGKIIGPATEFYVFEGRDNWWRIPLIYPYQIIIQDEPDYGTLNQYNGKASLVCPEPDLNRLYGIVAAAWCELCAVFKIRPDREKEFYQWAILDIGTGKVSIFGTEAEMMVVVKTKYPVIKLELKPLEWHYQQFERRAGEQKGLCNNNSGQHIPTTVTEPVSHVAISCIPTAKSDPNFFTYEGFRDWWRFPMTYPYQVIMCDTFTYGHLERYNGEGAIENGCEVSSGIISKVLRLAWNDHYAVFKVQPNREKRKYQWGTLDFRTGAVRLFDSEAEMYAKTRLNKLKHMPLEWHYKRFVHQKHVTDNRPR